jgi:hypothetical protein
MIKLYSYIIYLFRLILPQSRMILVPGSCLWRIVDFSFLFFFLVVSKLRHLWSHLNHDWLWLTRGNNLFLLGTLSIAHRLFIVTFISMWLGHHSGMSWFCLVLELHGLAGSRMYNFIDIDTHIIVKIIIIITNPTCVRDVMWSVLSCVSFCLYQIFHKPYISISSCKHLEHCQVQTEFALQYYWISYTCIEMCWLLFFLNIYFYIVLKIRMGMFLLFVLMSANALFKIMYFCIPVLISEERCTCMTFKRNIYFCLACFILFCFAHVFFTTVHVV